MRLPMPRPSPLTEAAPSPHTPPHPTPLPAPAAQLRRSPNSLSKFRQMYVPPGVPPPLPPATPLYVNRLYRQVGDRAAAMHTSAGKEQRSTVRAGLVWDTVALPGWLARMALQYCSPAPPGPADPGAALLWQRQVCCPRRLRRLLVRNLAWGEGGSHAGGSVGPRSAAATAARYVAPRGVSEPPNLQQSLTCAGGPSP